MNRTVDCVDFNKIDRDYSRSRFCRQCVRGLRDIITKFSGHHSMVEREDKFENGYIGLRG